jgi:hypothetical protein
MSVMLQSKLFMNTLREAPSEAEVASHRLLLRAGYIRQVAAGVYTYLPLGQKVLSNISNIIRQELDSSGAQEVLLPKLGQSGFDSGGGVFLSMTVIFTTKRSFAVEEGTELDRLASPNG